ncbi:MAG: hypothetical protein CMJ80_11845 [Planctomycetaceae bacterium]|nr:hypothetical protein [Planctomycetaceae bacterium]
MLALAIGDDLPAEDVTLNSATIGGDVIEKNAFNPSVVLLWGHEADGESARQWDHEILLGALPVGAYTLAISNLTMNTTYYYRSTAIDVFQGEFIWTDVASFHTLSPDLAEVRLDPTVIGSATSVELQGYVLSTGSD